MFSFLQPMRNPLGFDSADFLALGLAVVAVAVIMGRAALVSLAHKLAGRTILSMTILGALPIALRLALLAHYLVPTPRVADDFSYVLLGDTLAHFRLANAMHPMHRFFEGVFILQEPSYSSIYPLGQGFVLAFGQLVFGLPWAGVALSVGLLCALCYWMLRGWTSPEWAFLGGLLAAATFGPLSSWMNTYWGGAVSGIAGCLVFGALPRLKNAFRIRYAVFLGAGLGLQLLTRPFEFALLVVVVIFFFAPVRSLLIAGLVLVPALGLTLLHNRQVTGSWTTLPYQLSRYQYGIPTTFTFQPNPVPHRSLSVEQQIDYDAQTDAHKLASSSYVSQLGSRVRFYRFFFLAPLYLALPAFLFALREYRFIWISVALAIFWIGDAFYPFFYPHYIAAEACALLLVAIVSLERISRRSQEAVVLILAVCLAHFVFWYGMNARGDVGGLQFWDAIDAEPVDRIAIGMQLDGAPGKQLVFVHYSQLHTPQEWVHNAADIDRARVVWAIDLGPGEDAALERYYPDRHRWLLLPDTRPLRLLPIP
jgi:hypothetical protein